MEVQLLQRGAGHQSTEAICSSRRVGRGGGKVVRDGDRAHSRLSVWKGVHGRTGRNSYILNVISYTQSKGRAECFHFFFFFFKSTGKYTCKHVCLFVLTEM